ncbi:unnamed protein product [Peniophora sp. CBMAI 1063]|nr:unnamed protein product [Peniophora sp. CBMAI 1063]
MGQKFSVETALPAGKTLVPSDIILEIARKRIRSMHPPLAGRNHTVAATFNHQWGGFRRDLDMRVPFAAAPLIPEPEAYHHASGNLGWIELMHISRAIRNTLRTGGSEFWAASIGRLPRAIHDMLALSSGRLLDVFVDLAPWRQDGSRQMMNFLLNGTVPLARIRSLIFVDVRVDTNPALTIFPILAQMTALQSVDIYVALTEQVRGQVALPPTTIRFPIPDLAISVHPVRLSFTCFIARVNSVTHLSIWQSSFAKPLAAWTVTCDELLNVLHLSRETLETLDIRIDLPGEANPDARDPTVSVSPARIHFPRLTLIYFRDFYDPGRSGIPLVCDIVPRMGFRPDVRVLVRRFCVQEQLLYSDEISRYFGEGGLPPATSCTIDAARVEPAKNPESEFWPPIRVHYSTGPHNAGLKFTIFAPGHHLQPSIAHKIDKLVDVAANFCSSGISLHAPHVSHSPHFRRLRAGMDFSQELFPDGIVKCVWRPQTVPV